MIHSFCGISGEDRVRYRIVVTLKMISTGEAEKSVGSGNSEPRPNSSETSQLYSNTVVADRESRANSTNYVDSARTG